MSRFAWHQVPDPRDEPEEWLPVPICKRCGEATEEPSELGFCPECEEIEAEAEEAAKRCAYCDRQKFSRTATACLSCGAPF